MDTQNTANIADLRSETDQITNIIVLTFRKLFHSQEKLDETIISSELLRNEALKFKKNAVIVKRRMWWENRRNGILFGSLVLFVGSVLVLLIVVFSANAK
jgi:hypothetical protein